MIVFVGDCEGIFVFIVVIMLFEVLLVLGMFYVV